MSRLAPSHYRRLIEAENARVAEIDVSRMGLDVPHLEGWTVHDVIGHIGWIQRFVSTCLEATPDAPPSRASVGEPPLGVEVFDWLQESASRVSGAFDAADLEAEYPTWTGPQPGHWWLRRVAQELAMHRWDVQAAISSPEPIDADLARDGIDEVLEVFVPNRLQFDLLGPDEHTIHLHATDVENGEWMMHLGPDGLRWEHGHAKGDVAARGSMSDLLLMMWSRLPPASIEVFGDASLLERWQKAAAF